MQSFTSKQESPFAKKHTDFSKPLTNSTSDDCSRRTQNEAPKDRANTHSANGFTRFEPFVDGYAVAGFLQIATRRVLEMARRRQIPAHPLGAKRRTWRFRLSEIDAHFALPKHSEQSGSITSAVPVTLERTEMVAGRLAREDAQRE